MARALRSSGAPAAPTTATPATTAATNGSARSRVLKRKRTDEEHLASPRPAAPGELHDESSASPLTDLAPSPAVKHEAFDDPATTTAEKEASRSPTPGAFLDGSDVPPSALDAHKLLTVLEMFDTHNLLARHVPPAELSLRAMLKSSTHSIRTLRAAISSLVPAQSNSRAALDLELTAQRSFCELALGLLDEIAQKQLVSKDRTSIYQVSAEHKSKHRAESTQTVRFALQQTIHGVDYYTSFADETLTPQKAASLKTGQASLTAVLSSLPIPASSMPTLGAYLRKPITYMSPPQPPPYTLPAMLELSYGPRSSFAPTYDSAGSAITRTTMDAHLARRIEIRKARRAIGPPPLIEMNGIGKDVEMGVGQQSSSISPHPDLVPIDPSLVSGSEPQPPSPTPNPDNDPDLTSALEQLALEDSVRGLLQSNARAMAGLLDLQNERLQRWDGRDLSVLDPGEEEKELASCIERTLRMLVDLRPRTLLDSVSPGPTNIVPPASALRAVHRTIPVEPSPGYRGTLDPKKESALKDNATIKIGNIPPPAPTPAPAQSGTPVGGVKAVPRPGQTQIYGTQYPVQQYPAAYQYPAGAYAAAGQPGYATPVAQTGYATPTAGATYPAGAYPVPAGATPVGAYPTPGQAATYPTPGQAATYPTPNPAYPATSGASTPRVITNIVKPVAQGVWSPGQGYGPAATPTTAGLYTPTVHNPVVSATGYNPAVNATGYTPVVGTPGYNPAVTPTAGYSPAVTAATAYNPAVPAYNPAVYAATPIKPVPIVGTPVRGPIPAHVRSTPTPGTPSTPASYLPNAVGWNGTPARPT